jgi:hypothetical protein
LAELDEEDELVDAEDLSEDDVEVEEADLSEEAGVDDGVFEESEDEESEPDLSAEERESVR